MGTGVWTGMALALAIAMDNGRALEVQQAAVKFLHIYPFPAMKDYIMVHTYTKE